MKLFSSQLTLFIDWLMRVAIIVIILFVPSTLKSFCYPSSLVIVQFDPILIIGSLPQLIYSNVPLLLSSVKLNDFFTYLPDLA